jgi:hypothetical protein
MMVVLRKSLAPVDWFISFVLTAIFGDKAKAIQVCVNRFDDETKQAFLELYDKIDVDFVMPSETPELTIEYGRLDKNLPF